ncbi:MAG: SDR family NAD(P)-dependent oxidoreductase [Nitrospirota bacterium]
MNENNVVVITGGTKGIGKAMVKRYLKSGAHVITFFSKDAKAMEALRRELPASDAERFLAFQGSIVDESFLTETLQMIISKFGEINILINNAGMTQDQLFINMTQDEWDCVLSTNLAGTYRLTILAAELMKSNSSLSNIVNISSISGLYGRASQANYACSKGGIIGITKLLAWKYAGTQLRINAITPGLIATDMVSSMPQTKIEEILNAVGLRRMGTTKEVAEFVFSTTGEASSYLSGTCLSLDGGFRK